MQHQYLVFRLAGELYGITIKAVREIRAWQPTRPVYGAAPHIYGIVNLRQVSVPIVDLQLYLGGGATPDPEKCVVIILNIHNRSIGIVVDDVSDIMNIDNRQFNTNGQQIVGNEYLQGMYNEEDRTIFIFDQATLLTEGLSADDLEDGAVIADSLAG